GRESIVTPGSSFKVVVSVAPNAALTRKPPDEFSVPIRYGTPGLRTVMLSTTEPAPSPSVSMIWSLAFPTYAPSGNVPDARAQIDTGQPMAVVTVRAVEPGAKPAPSRSRMPFEPESMIVT